jgi:thioredoxin-like negative regulator of GroEL
VAHIFKDNELIGEITVLSISQSDTGLYNELFSTIKLYQPKTEADAMYMDGLDLLKDEKTETAKRLFAAAAALRQDDAEFRYMLAETLALTGYVSSARKQLEKCLNINPGHDRAEKLLNALAKLK